MSTHNVTGIAVTPGAGTLYGECVRLLRAPVSITGDRTASVWTFTPDLSAAEAQTFTDIVGTIRSQGVTLTVSEYQSLTASLATMRTFQQLSQADFIALAQNARDRQLFDVVTALIRVDRALMKD